MQVCPRHSVMSHRHGIKRKTIGEPFQEREELLSDFDLFLTFKTLREKREKMSFKVCH